jgi:mRNA interferase MazF
MRRGEIWSAAAGGVYNGKPRPVVILQDDRFRTTNSVTICGLTTDPTEAPLMRPMVAPSAGNRLRETCRLMVDKIMTVPRKRLGARIGRLDDNDIVRLNRAVLVFLGMAGASGEEEIP